MDLQDYIATIVGAHNELAKIPVKGQEVYAMASAMQNLHQLAELMSQRAAVEKQGEVD